jgi:hypothetical protein
MSLAMIAREEGRWRAPTGLQYFLLHKNGGDPRMTAQRMDPALRLGVSECRLFHKAAIALSPAAIA